MKSQSRFIRRISEVIEETIMYRSCYAMISSQLTFTCSKLTIETPENSCEIYSGLKIKTPERRQWRRSRVYIVNFEQISHLF